VGWLACCLFVVLLLPIGAMLYIDILQAKAEVSEQIKKVETLRRQVEQQRKDKDK
jgi:hypothetical protein